MDGALNLSSRSSSSSSSGAVLLPVPSHAHVVDRPGCSGRFLLAHFLSRACSASIEDDFGVAYVACDAGFERRTSAVVGFARKSGRGDEELERVEVVDFARFGGEGTKEDENGRGRTFGAPRDGGDDEDALLDGLYNVLAEGANPDYRLVDNVILMHLPEEISISIGTIRDATADYC